MNVTDRDQKKPPARTFDPHFGGERSFDEMMFPSPMGDGDMAWAGIDGAGRTVIAEDAKVAMSRESDA